MGYKYLTGAVIVAGSCILYWATKKGDREHHPVTPPITHENRTAVYADESKRQESGQKTTLLKSLEQRYVLRIVSKPGQWSGVWRVPRGHPESRKYYVIVEAIDNQGKPVSLDVTSEEDNKTAKVSTFGIRVDEVTFNRIRADKQDDGVIQNNRFGEKKAGDVKPQYLFSILGGAILEW